jgi:hypothetical protein
MSDEMLPECRCGLPTDGFCNLVYAFVGLLEAALGREQAQMG